MARGQWDYLSKLVIVGDPGVGKTSLLLRLTDDRFLADTDPTIGVEFGAHTLSLDNGDRIKIQVWDTAGSETFRSLTRSYYRGAAGALLVYDVTFRRSFEHVGRWLDDLREYADEGVSIVLIGNRTDLTSDEDDEVQEPPVECPVLCPPPDGEQVSTPPASRTNTPDARPPDSADSSASDAVPTAATQSVPPTAQLGRKEKRQVSRAEAATWAQRHGISFVETSAKTGDNVQEAFACAARDIHTRFLARATAPPTASDSTVRPSLETTVPRPGGSGGGCC